MRTLYSSLQRAVSFLLPALLLVVAGCSSTDSQLLELVPSSAPTVIVNNLTRFMDDAGYHTVPSTAPEWISGATELLGSPDEVAKALDVSHVVSYSLGGHDFVSVLKVVSDTELDALASKAGFAKDDASGYTVWKHEGLSIATKNHVAWIAPDAVAMAQQSHAKCLSDGNYTLWKGLAEFLSTRSTLGIVVCIEPAGPDQQGRYAAIDVEGNQEAASINASLMKADGEKYTNSSLTTLQTDFLRYLPRNFNCAFAMGVAPGFNWDSVAQFIESFGGSQARGFFDAVVGILNQCNGTFAIAADGYSLPAGSPAVLAMVHMPQAKVDSVRSDFIAQITSMGVPATLRPDGQTELAVPNMKVFVGSVDGYLAIGTQPFVADGSNPFTTAFEGQRAAAVVQLETLRT